MDINILALIFEVCIIPLLGILTKWVCSYFTKKMNEAQAKTDNEIFEKYITMLSDTINRCVMATNQTYVDTLKKEGKFDLEAQKTAFNMTKEAVLSILSEEALTYLKNILGDLDTYIDSLIEANVKLIKTN